MKLFLDDERDPPDESWTLVRDPVEAKKLLASGKVTEASFDHDLGVGCTGYDLLCWLENQVAFKFLKPPGIIRVHSANPVGAARMRQVIDSIYKLSME